MLIKTKAESDAFILRRGFNVVNQLNAKASRTDEIIKFMEHSTASRFSIRDKTSSGGVFLYDITPEQVLGALPNYNRVCVYDSMKQFDPYLRLQGDIYVDTKFNCCASLSTVTGITNRVAMQNPEYSLEFNLCDRVPKIQGFDAILDFIIKEELFGSIVEFTDYGVPVGRKHEPRIIWEIRNY